MVFVAVAAYIVTTSQSVVIAYNPGPAVDEQADIAVAQTGNATMMTNQTAANGNMTGLTNSTS